MQNELVKCISFDKECRESLLNGITKLSKAVKSTMGFAGRTVVIESPEHTHGIHTTKDGWTVAKSITLENPIENLGCRILKECAERTATEAGDGTTTSVVLAEALIVAGTKMITPEMNKTQVLRELSNATNDVIEILKSSKIDCTNDILLDVAKISCNNDEYIGGIIAEAYRGVGKDGIVTVEKSINNETTFEVIDGLKFDRGYSSPLFMNDRQREECVMENVHILCCDTEISTHLQLIDIFNVIVKAGKRLLIIAPCTSEFINSMVANVVSNKIGVCIVQPPNFGYKQHEQMSDIAMAVGATHFSEKTGDDLSIIKFEDLGFAKKVIVGKKRTVIVEGNGDSELIKKTANELKNTIPNQKNKYEVDFINERIASLIGGIGVIYVGGNSELEQKEKYDRVEDGICAVRSALEEGIIAGAGKPLFEIEIPQSANKERQIANNIISFAIKEPLTQILKNADLKVEDIYNSTIPKASGYDIKTSQYGDLIEMGIIDPFKVTKNALLNAVSVAITVLSTNTTITIQRA